MKETFNRTDQNPNARTELADLRPESGL